MLKDVQTASPTKLQSFTLGTIIQKVQPFTLGAITQNLQSPTLSSFTQHITLFLPAL